MAFRLSELPLSVRHAIEAQATEQAQAVRASAARPVTVVEKRETMNKTESRYAGHLEKLRLAGVILDFCYEAFKLRLAHNTFYTPDFLVVSPSLPVLQFHEVKGFMRDDAAVKVKVAAQLYYQFRFIIVRAEAGGRWRMEEIQRWDVTRPDSTPPHEIPFSWNATEEMTT